MKGKRRILYLLIVTLFVFVGTLTACAGVNLTLTFEVDGKVYATVSTMGQEVVEMPKNPEKEGFIFDGWYWDKDVWEKPFTANSLLEMPLSENMIVYAKWKTEAEKHEHAYSDWEIVTQATCTAEGLQKRVCSCGAEQTEAIQKLAHNYETKYNATNHWSECSVCQEKVNITAHTFGEWSEVTPATCTAEGLKKRVCFCGAEEMAAIPKFAHTYETKHDVTNHWEECSVCHVTINVTAHTYGEWTVVTQATCTVEGQKKRVCSCGAEESEAIPKQAHNYETKYNAANHWSECSVCHEKILETAHTFGEWTVVTQATCTAEGSKKRVCSCGAEHTEAIPKLTHSYETKHDAANHWEECSVCNEKINVTPHTFGEWTEVTAATCTAEGQKKRVCSCGAEESEAIQKLAHSYETKFDNTSHWSECSVCQEKVNITAHTFGDWTEVTAATCTAEGQKKHTCTVCRLEETTVIPVVAHSYATQYDDNNHWNECSVCHETVNVTAHTFGEWAEVSTSTCTTEGQKKRTCSCGAEESEAIPKLGHSYYTRYDETKHWQECALCGENVDEAAHTYGEWAVTTPATCTSEGQKKRVCTCGAEETAVIPIASHTYGEWTEVTAATCTAEGLQKCVCSVCGEEQTKAILTAPHTYELKHDETNHWEECSVCHEKVNITAHTYGKWTEVISATCTTKGIQKRVCSVCGEEETEAILTVPHTYELKNNETNHWEECSVCHEKINATAHTFGEWTEVTAATCTTEGLQKRVCSVCGEEETEAILTVPHTYELKYDESNHWSQCSVCSEVVNQNAHCYENEICTVCGKDYGTKGLKYEKLEGGYKVVGIGTAKVTAIEIPSKHEGEPVIAIGSSAFYWCSSLTSIAIPNSVTSIGYGAFSRCSSLTSIAIPESVTSIGSSAFERCSSLETITVAEGNTKYKSAGNCIIETATKTLIAGCKGSVIPTDGSVTSIGDNAFEDCSTPTSIAIPNGVTSIGRQSFSGCSSLTSIEIGNSVTSIGSLAFSECSSLEIIKVAEGNTKYHSAGNCLIETATKTLIAGCKNSVIPTDGSVTSIGINAFYECSSLTNIAIPTGVTSIGSLAFAGCYSLTSIEIGDSVTSIGDNAFSRCSSLMSISIPSSVTSIGYYAFDRTGIWNNTEDNSVVYADKWAIGYKGTISEATLKADTVGIGSSAFRVCSSLTSISIPNSVTSIGNQAFSGCSSLTSIAIGDSVMSIGEAAFFGCSSLTSIAIPNSVTSIGSSAFNGCDSLTIYTGAAAKPSGWDSIDYPVVWDYKNNDVADDGYIYTMQNGIRYGIKDGAAVVARQPSNITQANIASEITYKDTRYSVTSIGEAAFSGCSSLTSITIPDSVTSIGSFAFNECNSLTSIAIPDSVTYIGGVAFQGCSSLTSVAIPNNVTSLGINAFFGCSRLTSIEYQGTKAEWIAITKGNHWNYNTGEYKVTCTDETLTKAESQS